MLTRREGVQNHNFADFIYGWHLEELITITMLRDFHSSPFAWALSAVVLLTLIHDGAVFLARHHLVQVGAELQSLLLLQLAPGFVLGRQAGETLRLLFGPENRNRTRCRMNRRLLHQAEILENRKGVHLI